MRPYARPTCPPAPASRFVLGSLVLLGAATPAPAQTMPGQEKPAPIEDNSFLIEEAYNQERGVVQHISTFSRSRGGDGWSYSFTQEWPLLTQRHQLSFTLPVENTGGARGGTGLGDLALNYRYQLLGGESRVAFAPRVSALLPTGDEGSGRGSGGAGLQVNLPLSLTLADRWVAHSNAGLTHTSSARSPSGQEAGTTGFNLGQSVIWLLHPNLNLMLEAAWAREEEVVGADATEHGTSFVVSPGIRGAVNLPSGLQIVPGIAVPVGVGPSRGERAVFLYLSFEHPFSTGRE